MENSKAKALADELQAKVEEAAERAAAHEAERAEQQAAHEAHLSELQNTEKTSVKEAVMRLLQLIYFSKVFSCLAARLHKLYHSFYPLHESSCNDICLDVCAVSTILQATFGRLTT